MIGAGFPGITHDHLTALVPESDCGRVCAFGLAALLWPNKFMPLFEILMFPWAASSRAIRANGIAAIGLAILLVVTRLSDNR
jgi:hypothetical protein